MSIYKITNNVDGDEDPMFVEADNEDAAVNVIYETIGAMPRNMLSVQQIDALPDGEELLNA